MAKIPTILEAGRGDGKLATANSIFDENKGMFQSEINDIQDTLNSDNPNKPLSAKQGKILKDLLDSKVIEAGSVPIDTEPIEGNITHLVNSDGLAKEFNKYNTEIILGGVYDISSHNNGIAFESLQALLSSSNLSTLIPTSVRHGGMSIRFIQSSDNKYVQYRLMSDTFNKTPSNWQGVDDEPTIGSNNLITSKGTYNLAKNAGFFTLKGANNSYVEVNVPVIKGHTYILQIIGNRTLSLNNISVNFSTFWISHYSVSGSYVYDHRTTKQTDQISYTIKEKFVLNPIDNEEYNIGIMSDIGTDITFQLIDITEHIELKNNLSDTGVFYSYTARKAVSLTPVFKAVKGHTYRLVCLTRHWTASLIGDSGSTAFSISLNNTDLYNFTGHDLITGNTPKPVVFTADADNDYNILIRADAGTTISYVIYDITGESNDTITDKIIISLDGADSSGVEKKFKLEAGKSYKMTLSQKSWPSNNHSYPSPGAITKFQIYYVRNSTTTPILFNRITLNTAGLPLYSYNIEAVEADYYAVFFRGDVGVHITITIEEYDTSIIALNGGRDKIRRDLANLKKPYPYGGTTPLNLLFFSDPHNSIDCIKRIIDFNTIFAEYIDDMLSGGDNVFDKPTDNYPFVESTVPGSTSILTAIGNHECITGSTLLSSKEVFDIHYGNHAANWSGATFPEDYQTLGLMYWYKDYVASKVRLVTLDCMHYDEAQHNWLDNVLDDAVSNNYHVIICSHYPPAYKVTEMDECTFNSLYPWEGQYLDARASALVHEKTTDTGNPLKFVCWLAGHVHNDYFGHITDYPEQYYICVDKCSDTGGERDFYPRQISRNGAEKESDAFDIISINTYLGVLSIYRIGNNTDCFGRQKNRMSFDYVHHKLLGNS